MTSHFQLPTSDLIHVLQLVRPARGGIRKHVQRLLDTLAGQGIQSSLGTPGESLNAWSLPEGVSAHPISLTDRPHPLRDARAAKSLAQLLHDIRPNLVHAHGYRAAWIAALATSHLRRAASDFSPPRILATAHNLYPARASLSAMLALRYVQPRLAGWIAVTNAVRESLTHAGVPYPRITVIPNGIDPDALRPAPREETRARFGLPLDTPLVTVIARLEPAKGVADALRAFTMLRRALPDARLWVVGEGPDRDALEAFAHDRALRGSVEFLGWRDDAPSLLAAADACLIPSRAEGQSLVALEAMALGVPVVASDVGGLPEMIRDGETGLLAPPADAPAMARALSRLLQRPDLREMLTLKASREVRERWNEADMIRRTADLYRRIAGPPAAPPKERSVSPTASPIEL